MEALAGPKLSKFHSSIKENYVFLLSPYSWAFLKKELTWKVNYLILTLNKNPNNIGLNTFLVTT